MLKKIIKITREKGVGTLAAESLRFFMKMICYPYCMIRVKKSEKIENSINFALNGCFGLISPLQHKSEISGLILEVQKQKPKNVLEIGTAQGGTLFLISKASAKNAKIISVDLPNGEFGGGYPSWKTPLYKSFAGKNQIMTLIRADSHKQETFEQVKKELNGEKLDFLFIDGDHTYDGVKRDFKTYSSLVKKGGMIALHDIIKHSKESGCEVDKFWNEIRGKHYTEFIEPNQHWGGIGLIKK